MSIFNDYLKKIINESKQEDKEDAKFKEIVKGAKDKIRKSKFRKGEEVVELEDDKIVSVDKKGNKKTLKKLKKDDNSKKTS